MGLSPHLDARQSFKPLPSPPKKATQMKTKQQRTYLTGLFTGQKVPHIVPTTVNPLDKASQLGTLVLETLVVTEFAHIVDNFRNDGSLLEFGRSRLVFFQLVLDVLTVLDVARVVFAGSTAAAPNVKRARFKGFGEFEEFVVFGVDFGWVALHCRNKEGEM